MTEQEVEKAIFEIIAELEDLGKVIAALRQERELYDQLLKDQDVLIKRLGELTRKMDKGE